MTNNQQKEVNKVETLLTKCREHLDHAMYGLGEINDEEFGRVRTIYDSICRTLDLF